MKVKQMTGIVCMAFVLLLSACNNPVSPDNGGDGGTNPGGGTDTGNGTNTSVRFVNKSKYTVTVYADESRLKELAIVETNDSKTVAHEASTSEVAFYPKYYVDIESIKIPYVGTALVTRVDAGKTTEVTVADLTAFETGSAYIKLENESTDSLTLNKDRTELTPEGSSSTILLQNQIGIYVVAPESANSYKLMKKSTSTEVALPPELVSFDKGYLYVLKYADDQLKLTKKIYIKQEIIPLDAPANVNASVLANAQIKITWSAVTGAGGYRIYRSTVSNGTYTLAGEVNAGEVEYTDTELPNNTVYYYKVASIYENGEDAESVSVEAVLVNLSMVLVEGGSYSMGSLNGTDDEKPVHQVTLDSFYMGKYEVTQKEWQAVMNNNPSELKGDTLPVERVSWYAVIVFCNTLSINENLTPCYSIDGKTNPADWGSMPTESNDAKWDTVIMDRNANGYRLPTEAEWEYAAKGGTYAGGFKYSGSDTLGDVGWYRDNSDSKRQPVGTKAANALGLYDLSGNVWEWCWDWSGNYSSNSQTNPTGPTSGPGRIIRGGAWNDSAPGCSVFFRAVDVPGNLNNPNLGFRPVRSL